jgi:peptide/nickel transport system substrate-binding protein
LTETQTRRLRQALIAAFCVFLIVLLIKFGHHSASPSRESGETSAESPSTSKTITIAQSADADTLDPSDVNNAATLNIARMLWATLYDVSAQGVIEPYLAESYQYSPDGHSITFKLRPGLKCEDGTPLTARDVAYSFDRTADPKFNFTGNSAGFVLPALGYQGSRVDGPLTVTLLVKKYNPIAIGLISEVLIVCRKPYEQMTGPEAAAHPVATGPYRLVAWNRDDRIILERNANYTLPAPSYDRVVWRVIPEASTRSAELIAGNVDIITNVPSDQMDAINSSDTAKIETISSTRRIYVGFNQKEKFSSTDGGRAIKNPAVRVAMQYAIDVPTLCEALLRTPCARAATMVVAKNDHSGIPPYPYDPDRAERLLDAAGYPRGKDGVRFDLTLQAPRGLNIDPNVAQAIGQYLTDIGVRTNVDFLDPTVYFQQTRQHDTGPLFLQGTGGSSWSALYDMSDLSSPKAGTNYTSWTDPEFYNGWNELEKTRDPTEQQAIINHMLQIFHDRGAWLFLYFQPDIYGVSNRVHWKPRSDELILPD